jgi:hypothetical protein
MKEPQIYITDWNHFYKYCDKKAKTADCRINNKGWGKLREYHLENYLKRVQNPYGFLFNIKFNYKYLYNKNQCLSKFFHKYSRIRKKSFDSIGKSVVEFPSWKGFLRRND